MTFNRRSFLKWAGLAAGAAAAGPLLGAGRASGAPGFKAKRVIVVSIAGGLRQRESLGMAEGATMPNLFGDVPLIAGFGDAPAGAPKIAPEYQSIAPTIVVPKPRPKPLFTEGALITNLRYAEGAPGHLQGAACLVSGAYNTIDNRADAHAPAPTLFELHRRRAGAPATDAWAISVVAGFYRALQSSDHPDYGPRFGASWLSPPAVMSPIIPIIASGERTLVLDGKHKPPTIANEKAEIAAVRRLSGLLDGNSPPYGDDGVFRASPAENASIEEHLASLYGDSTYQSLYPKALGIGTLGGDGELQGTGDAATTYHAEQILLRYQPAVTFLSLLDVDTAHNDFNGYLRNQRIADACVSHLWAMIEATPGLAGETAMIVLPEHGRQLYFNGKAPDSLGRSGLDHGGGDDGDRDVWALFLGPDFKPGVHAPTGVVQPGRASGRYETIDAIMSAAALLGHDEEMRKGLVELGYRPGLVLEGMLA